jgi:hypothetical protein
MFEWDGCGGYIRGYTGRYVANNASGYIPACLSGVGSPIEDVKDKDKDKGEGDGDGESCADIEINPPVPQGPIPQTPPSPPSVEKPLLSGVDFSPGESLRAETICTRSIRPPRRETGEGLLYRGTRSDAAIRANCGIAARAAVQQTFPRFSPKIYPYHRLFRAGIGAGDCLGSGGTPIPSISILGPPPHCL